ncbi:MAG: hypothetical protein DA407_13740, partial [Bacteroidetes bacterium]
MKIYKLLNITIFACLCLFSLETTEAQDLKSQVDEYLLSHSQPNAPGASVLIAKDGKAIYKKAVGMANLELNVPL